MTISTKNLFLENHLDSDVVLQKVIDLGVDFLGKEWRNVKRNQVKVTRIMSGVSNYVYHITSSTSAIPFLLRLRGQPSSQVLIETVIFALFSERKLGPKLYGFFEEGRIVEYLPSKTLGWGDVLNPETVAKVGALLPTIHSINVPISKTRNIIQIMREWLEELNISGFQNFEISQTTVSYKAHPQNIATHDLVRELDIFEKWAADLYENTLVFCHNDLVASNILELNSTKELVFIDWEYACYNWRGYDLATFLAQRTINYRIQEIKVDEDLNDKPPDIRLLCEAFLKTKNELKNQTPSINDHCSELEALVQECLFFWPLTHLCWAISAIKLDYINFGNGVNWNVIARERLAVYYHFKIRSEKIYEKIMRE